MQRTARALAPLWRAGRVGAMPLQWAAGYEALPLGDPQASQILPRFLNRELELYAQVKAAEPWAWLSAKSFCSASGTETGQREEQASLSRKHKSLLHSGGIPVGVPGSSSLLKRYARKPLEPGEVAELPKTPGVAFPDGHIIRDQQGIESPEQAAEPVPMQAQEGEEALAPALIPEVWGRVHSIESFSAVDGPAIRSVVFLQGCLRRCNFCGNPDTWSSIAKCQRLSSKAITARLKRNLAYYADGGGVTISGGEPMMQPQFVAAVFKEAHALGITTCLDTAGYGHKTDYAAVLPHTDTVMLCTKAMDPKLYFQMVEVKQQIMLNFAKAVADYGVPLVIRFVLVPGMTDTAEEVEALVAWAKEQPTLVGIEMLPYHRLGVNKWKALGLDYPLEGMQPPSKDVVDHWKSFIVSQGIKVML